MQETWLDPTHSIKPSTRRQSHRPIESKTQRSSRRSTSQQHRHLYHTDQVKFASMQLVNPALHQERERTQQWTSLHWNHQGYIIFRPQNHQTETNSNKFTNDRLLHKDLNSLFYVVVPVISRNSGTCSCQCQIIGEVHLFATYLRCLWYCCHSEVKISRY